MSIHYLKSPRDIDHIKRNCDKIMNCIPQFQRDAVDSHIRDWYEIKDKILELVKELKTNAKRDEVKVLEKYINYWNPAKFVTQNEVEAIVKEIIKKIKAEKPKK